jgi:hypothetical protein
LRRSRCTRHPAAAAAPPSSFATTCGTAMTSKARTSHRQRPRSGDRERVFFLSFRRALADAAYANVRGSCCCRGASNTCSCITRRARSTVSSSMRAWIYEYHRSFLHASRGGRRPLVDRRPQHRPDEPAARAPSQR